MYLTSHQDIEHELNNFFSPLLIEPQTDHSTAINKITKQIPTLVTNDHNDSLRRPITVFEVELVVINMTLGKSLGPYDFTFEF